MISDPLPYPSVFDYVPLVPVMDMNVSSTDVVSYTKCSLILCLWNVCSICNKVRSVLSTILNSSQNSAFKWLINLGNEKLKHFSAALVHQVLFV